MHAAVQKFPIRPWRHRPPLRQRTPAYVQAIRQRTNTTGVLTLQRSSCPCGGSCPRCQENLPVQPKLKIGAPNDKYEQEADRVADQVMWMPNPAVQRQAEEKERVQTRRSGGPSADKIRELQPMRSVGNQGIQRKANVPSINRQSVNKITAKKKKPCSSPVYESDVHINDTGFIYRPYSDVTSPGKIWVWNYGKNISHDITITPKNEVDKPAFLLPPQYVEIVNVKHPKGENVVPPIVISDKTTKQTARIIKCPVNP